MMPLFARIGGHGPADDVWSRPGVAFKRHGLTLELIRHDTEQAAARALQSGIEVTLNPRSMVARYVKVLHDQIRRQPVGFPVNGDECLELHLTGKPVGFPVNGDDFSTAGEADRARKRLDYDRRRREARAEEKRIDNYLMTPPSEELDR